MSLVGGTGVCSSAMLRMGSSLTLSLSLTVDEFGWRDRGVFQCYAENGFGNATDRVDIKLNYHYRWVSTSFKNIYCLNRYDSYELLHLPLDVCGQWELLMYEKFFNSI